MWWYVIGFILVFCIVAFEYSYKGKEMDDDEIGVTWFLAFMSWAGVAILLSSYLGDYLHNRKEKK